MCLGHRAPAHDPHLWTVRRDEEEGDALCPPRPTGDCTARPARRRRAGAGVERWLVEHAFTASGGRGHHDREPPPSTEQLNTYL
jgi:hypothetical protein